MSTVNTNSSILANLGLTQPQAASGSTASTAISGALGEQQFLQLMVAQLQNQDPTQPMQSGSFLGQLAQFGTVSGIQGLQSSFSQFASSMQSNQALMASSLVGHTVLAPGSSGSLSAGGSISGAINLSSAASDVAVGVYDNSGQLVSSMDLGPQAAGQVPFTWNGQNSNGVAMPAGTYQIRANVINGATTVAANTLIAANVDSVSLGGSQGIMLNLAGMGPVALSSVTQIS
ncbi:MAG: flagellar hook assembly protein FlgD [Acidiferrobacterales bacterium]